MKYLIIMLFVTVIVANIQMWMTDDLSIKFLGFIPWTICIILLLFACKEDSE